jgi:DNA repair protein RecO (recombination protein O)
MLVKTEAISLKRTPFAENSAVAHIYTRDFGLLSFMVKNLQGKSSKGALLNPGTFSELVFYLKQTETLRHIKEIKPIEPYPTQNPVKLSVLLFYSELLHLSVPEGQPDESLFAFFKTEVSRLNRESTKIEWLTHSFIVKLAGITGHNPVGAEAGHHSMLNFDNEDLNCFKQLWEGQIPVQSEVYRKLLLNKLVEFASEQIFPGRQIKSYAVLKSLFED